MIYKIKSKLPSRTLFFVIALGLASVPVAAQNGVVFYTDKAAWEAASAGVTFIDFEDIAAPGGVADFSTPRPCVFDPDTCLTISGVRFVSNAVAPDCPPEIQDPDLCDGIGFLQVVDPAFDPQFFDWNSGAVALGGPSFGFSGGTVCSGISAFPPPDVTAVSGEFMITHFTRNDFGNNNVLRVFLADGTTQFIVFNTFDRPTRAFVGVTSDQPILYVRFVANCFFGGIHPLVDNFAFGGTSLTPSQILDFFDTSVTEGNLVGQGPGGSARGRLNALQNMIMTAGDLIEDGLIDEACQQLLDAFNRTDGLPRPPDYVAGSAAAELATLIQNLMADLGCL
jgi:hypothetical protein